MALGKRSRAPQQELFVIPNEIQARGNSFYRALNQLLDKHGFDAFAEKVVSGVLRGYLFAGRPRFENGYCFRWPPLTWGY